MQAFWNKYQSYGKPATLFFIIALAALLRCYHLQFIPLTNDELSALYRLHYASFTDLITYGVKPDGHPAFIQLFLFYYVGWFGTSPLILKLPFIICGVASVFVAYKVFSQFFNTNTGLMVSGFMATSQFFIMHSQTARPYAFGLLVTLLFTQQLLTISYHKGKTVNYILAGLMALLAASIHYIALLTCTVIAITFIVNSPSYRKKLMLTFFISFVFYLPQVFIFYTQLKTGGVGTWLGKPDVLFIVRFVKYLCQFNAQIIVLFVAGILFSAGALLIRKTTLKKDKVNALSVLIVFAATYTIAYCYSVWRNPVLQYPVLLFATPFLLGFVFYGLSLLPKRVFALVFLTCIMLQCYALIIQRKHYDVFYNQSYKAAVETITKSVNRNTPLFLNGNHTFYFDYYFNEKGFAPNIINARIDSLTYQQFYDMINSVYADTIVISHGFYLSYEYVSIARMVFADSISFTQHAFNETYVLKRNHNTDSAKTNILFNDTIEFGSPRQIQFTATSHITNIEASVSVSPNQFSINPQLVLVVKDEHGKQVLWRAQHYAPFVFDSVANTVFLHVPVETTKGKTYTVETFVWNNGKNNFNASMPNLHIYKGNVRMYGTTMPEIE